MLTAEDKECIRQWMLDSLDGNAILEDGDLPSVSEVTDFTAFKEAILAYGTQVANATIDKCEHGAYLDCVCVPCGRTI